LSTQLSKSVTLETPANHVELICVNNLWAHASISLFGGHLLSYVPSYDQRERLWLSRDTWLDGTRSIRGGVPVCWPWFGDHPARNLPAHGYVRNQQWRLVSSVDTDDATIVRLRPCAIQNAMNEDGLELELSITVGRQLTLALSTRNTSDRPRNFGAALHSYFEISDIHNTCLKGLSGQCLDKTEDFARKVTPNPYLFEAETDRIHVHPGNRCWIETPDYAIEVNSRGHDSVVVWNPWRAKSAELEDFHDEGFQSMLCVESAITQGFTLAAQQTHTLTQTFA
jgi:glucose-6-phosphate 1-epimerase